MTIIAQQDKDGVTIVFPAFDKRVIKDYNGEGYDSVDSEDFEPGFGCVPIEEVKVIPGPPDMPPIGWSKSHQENYELLHRTDKENEEREREYLQRKGINF